MGTHLVHLFKNTKDEVYVTSRRKRDDEDNIHYLRGNAHDVEFLKNVSQIKDWDTIVDFMIYSGSMSI